MENDVRIRTKYERSLFPNRFKLMLVSHYFVSQPAILHYTRLFSPPPALILFHL